ncbi:Uncharacterized protein SCF082_LOCUS13147 [Durusdinium trenchii]|uniref:Uncharacterized protein n=1 Tax=Durusdinium trenchii TaxID=1381693 RepID=A0ABP0JPI5_9DINO
MINLGHLKYLTQFDKMEGYWRNLLKDYPDHPVLGQEATSVPLTLYGDEGQALGGSWMNYHWCPDLSPCISTSACSRFLICCIPASMYVFDENGVNLTLQAATAAIRDSFNELSTTGVPILDPKTGERVLTLKFWITNIKGDWKFLHQTFSFQRYATFEEVCWMCRCTKGSNDAAWSFTNVHPTAPWMATIYQDSPWLVQPSLASLQGFNLKMLAVDILHAFHLGCGRDLCASAIRMLASRPGHWQGRTQEDRLQSATVRLREYAKANKLTLTLRRLTKVNLTWESSEYPELRCKGYDTFVVCKWLSAELTTRDCGDDLLATVCWSADSFVRVMSKAGMFMTNDEWRHKIHVGHLFLCSYLQLASRALQRGERLWRLRPKFHLLWHVVHEHRSSQLNPTVNSTWMDEDAMKRWMRITRMTHKRTAAIRTLQRFLLGLPAKLRSIEL